MSDVWIVTRLSVWSFFFHSYECLFGVIACVFLPEAGSFEGWVLDVGAEVIINIQDVEF